MKKVVIFGTGAYAQAISSLLSENNVQHTLVSRHDSCNEQVDIAFMAVPTQSLRDVYSRYRSCFTPSSIVVNCSKGIEEATHLLPHQILADLAIESHYLSLIGPSFADEMINRDPTIVSLGYNDHASAALVKDLISTEYFAVEPMAEYRLLELAGALKNIYAILCGYADGLGLGFNTRVRIILRIKTELLTLAEALSYDTTEIDAPGIIGDQILTCMSPHSRNFSYGYSLATKNNVGDLLGQTVEGYYTCHSINTIAKQYSVEIPLAQLVSRIVDGDTIDTESFIRAIE